MYYTSYALITNVTLGFLKRKMERDGTKPGESFVLKTMGNSLTVQVGVPKDKTKRKSVSKLSLETIMEISNILNLSKRKTKLNKLGRVPTMLTNRSGQIISVE